MAKKFRKKPVVIEAVEFREGANCLVELKGFLTVEYRVNYKDGKAHTMVIPTPEGYHIANIGDWIIRGIANEFYPCKAHIFEATYEAVD